MSELAPALTWDTGKYDVQKKLGQFVQYFQVSLPTTNTGIPTKLVLPGGLIDTLIHYGTTDDVPDEILDGSLVEVDSTEGFPAVEGLPIWERLDGEPIPYYKVFKEYRDMVMLSGTRALARIAEKYDIPGKVLTTLSKVYHWQLRCKFFDSYNSSVAARQRQYKIEKLESSHSSAAAIMLEKGLAYLEAHPEQLNPKVALQMVEVGMKAGRLSLGLAGDKAAGPAANININQTSNIASGGGEIEVKQTAAHAMENADTSYFQSIVHILDGSGALDEAKSKVIDATFTEVESTDEAIEGS